MTQYALNATLQNATITQPKVSNDMWGNKAYYLNQQNSTIIVTATNGYSFESDGTLTYQKDATTQATMTVPATHTGTVTITLPSDINWSVQKSFTLTLSAVVSKPKTTMTFSSNDDGLVWSNNSIVDDGTGTQTNTITVQKGYKLSGKLRVTCTTADGTSTTSYFGSYSTNVDGDDPNNNTYAFTIPTGYVSFTLYANNSTYKEYDIVATLQNATITLPKATVDDMYNETHYYLDPKNTTIILTASDGYSFENDGTLVYQQDATTQTTMTVPATHTGTVTISLPSDINWLYQKKFTLTMGAVVPTVVDNSGGFTNIYKADYTNLLKFSSEVIAIVTATSSSTSVQYYDVTEYINNLVMLPFNVPSDKSNAIVAGNETFKTELPIVTNNYLTVDLGKIIVNEQYNNAFDYYQVKTRLMLPYTNMVDLDPQHVINKTISIKYFVNVVNGDTTINVYSDGDLFYTEQVSLANEVPFISSVRKGTQYTVINQLKTMFRNDILQAYIIIEQPTPILNSDYYPTNEKGTLKGYNGNVKASLLNNLNIDSSDLATLQNLLETGVRIK